MTQKDTCSQFSTHLLRPTSIGEDDYDWAFVVLPLEASAKLPRRGRTTINGTMNGHGFSVLLEPDGQKSHWLKIDASLLKMAKTGFGELAHFEIMAVAREPEPDTPSDFTSALQASPEAQITWERASNIARIDWIHWISSTKQACTRAKRIEDACSMLASGKKNVCCFDSSGFYSKAFSAPKTTS